MGNVIIDGRMREFEKRFFEGLGYNLIELHVSEKVYSEISSHVDIFMAKINDVLVVEKSQYDYVKDRIRDSGTKIVLRK